MLEQAFMRSLIETQARTEPQKLDVLFVNPGSPARVYQQLASEFSAIEPPTMAALYAESLRRKQISVDIIDAPAFGFTPDDVGELVRAYYAPRLIVLVVQGCQPSASTQTMPSAGAISRALKSCNPAVRILLTGTHPAALPRRTLEEEAVDFVCDGEGPETIIGLVNHLTDGGRSLEAVPNLWYRTKNGTVGNSAPAALIEDLDEQMPGPALDLLPMERYRAHNWHCFQNIDDRQPYASIHTSLGCPYECSFCCINAPFGRPSYRMWSLDAIVRQFDELVSEYGVKNIKIVDEMFVLNRRHVIGLCERLIQRGYDLNIWAYARIDTVKDEYLRLLREAGVRWLALGIESGSRYVRDGVEKGRFGANDILSVIRRIQEAGIYVIGNYVFGLPDDDITTMQQTLNLALNANCEFANFYTAMAYPGSKLYDMALELGWELPGSWLGYSQHSYETYPLRTESLSSSDVLRFRDEAFTRYFRDARYLESVRLKFGTKVVEHIGRMLEQKLSRRLFEEDGCVSSK